MPASDDEVKHSFHLMEVNGGTAGLLREAREAQSHDPKRAAELAEAVAMVARQRVETPDLAAALLLLGQVRWRQADFPAARAATREAIALFHELKDEPGLVAALNTDGNVSQLLGEYAVALETHHRCLTLRRKLGDRVGEAATLNNLGAVHFDVGDFPGSLDYHLQSLHLKAEIGDRLGEALSLGNIGTVCFELGDYPGALDYQQRSLAMRQELGDRAGEAYPLGNLGELYLRLGNHADALAHLQRALEIRKETGDRTGEAFTLGNLGRVYHGMKDIPAALDHLTRSLRLSEEIGHAPALINALLALANLQLHDLPAALRIRAEAWGSRGAISLLEQALQLARQIGARQHVWEAHQGLAEAHKQEKRPVEALAHFERFHALKEELLSEETSRRVSRMQILHDLKSTRREWGVRQRHGEELTRAHGVLRATRRERRELHEAVSQELYEPLAALLPRIDALATAPLPDAARAQAAAIHAEAARLLERLQGLIRSSDIPSQSPRLHRSPVMLDALLAGVVALHEQGTGGAPVGPIRLMADPCPVEVDPLLAVEAFDHVLEEIRSAAVPGAELRVVVHCDREMAIVTVDSPAGGRPLSSEELENAAKFILRSGGELVTAPVASGELLLRFRFRLHRSPADDPAVSTG